MIYVMIFGAIFSFSYFLFWESSLDGFHKKQTHINHLKTKIKIEKIYLKANSLQKIKQLQKKIIQTNKEIIVYKDNNNYIKNKIKTISSLIYNEETWGEYLYSISQNAKKYNVQILNFTNTLVKNKGDFGHILDISLKSSANFKDTLLFINSLETSSLVVDIHNLSIKADDKLYTDLNLSVWGITY
jgi:Tfp pilus assembly protein PilO